MNGVALAAELRRRWPGLGVVIMTGFDETLAPRAALPSQERLLVKPFAPSALVRAVLDIAAPVTASGR